LLIIPVRALESWLGSGTLSRVFVAANLLRKGVELLLFFLGLMTKFSLVVVDDYVTDRSWAIDSAIVS
jgi:hypothetical protein